MKKLLKRLEILNTAIDLDDKDLIASQQSALKQIVNDNSYSDALQSEISIVISDLETGKLDEAHATIKSFLLACYGGNNLSGTPLANELGQLSAQFSEYIMQRDGIIRRTEYFIHDYTAQCGQALEELLRIQKSAAEEKLRQAEEEYATAELKLQKLIEQRNLNQAFPSKESNRAQNEAYREALILLCQTGCDPETSTALQTAYTVGHIEDINQITDSLRKRATEIKSNNEEISILIDIANKEIEKLKNELETLNQDETCKLINTVQNPEIRRKFLNAQEAMIRRQIAAA
ncbi:MAG: hypothetical protein IJ566_04780 [Cardiobacteriaceae bacterium]|nr:hypothetical protein [Cardiobacteriaceae bacterium]